MNSLEKELRVYGARRRERLNTEFAPDQGKLIRTLESSRAALYENEALNSVSWPEFVYWQSGYIRKRWWILQAGLLLALWCGLAVTEQIGNVSRLMGTAAPLFVVLLVPELWKSRTYHTEEVEGAAYFSTRQIYGARLLLFAMVDAALLSVFCVAASFTLRITLREMMIQFFLPFNVSCCICFRALCGRRMESEYAALGLCGLWAGIWVWILLREAIYGIIALPVWEGAVLLSMGYMGYSIYRVLRDCESLTEVRRE